MREIPWQAVLTAHADTVSSNSKFLEELSPLVQFLRLRGSGPVPPLRLATALRLSPTEMEARLPSSILVVGPDGNIHTAPGPHQIHLDGETLASWCALDTLLYPLLVGQAAHVVSTCPATGRSIRLTVTEQGIADLDPEGAVVSLLVPSETTNVCNVQETICAYGHFFVDREAASTWPDLHPEAVLLSVEDAARVAREMGSLTRASLEQGEH